MPLGEFIGEVLLRGVFEIVFYAVTYYTGAIVLGLLTLGQFKIAPLSTVEDTNRHKNRWNDWSIWLYRPMQPRLLKAGVVCLVGMSFWIALGISLFIIFRPDKKESEQSRAANPIPSVTRAAYAPRPPDSRGG